MVNGNIKPFLVCFLVQNNYNSAFSVYDSFPLVQLQYSLNTFCTQPETNQVL